MSTVRDCAIRVGLSLALIATLGACSAGSSAESGDVAPNSDLPPSTAEPDVTSTSALSPTVDEASSVPLADGEHTGFVAAFDGTTLVFDPAEILTGEDALDAAFEDEGIDDPGGLPNDFYLRNTDSAVLELLAAPDLTVSMLDNVTMSARAVDPTEFQAFLAGDRPSWAYAASDSFFATVEVRDNRVVSIQEFYLP